MMDLSTLAEKVSEQAEVMRSQITHYLDRARMAARANTIGQVTPVHVYTSGDEAELFLNGKSLGRKKKVFEKVKTDDPELGAKALHNSANTQVQIKQYKEALSA